MQAAHMGIIRSIAVLLGCCAWSAGTACSAQPAADAPAADAGAADAAESELTQEQQQIAKRFDDLERLLLRMAELTAPTDPRRAALLKRAVAQSKDRAIGERFGELVELLRQERLASVVRNQGEVRGDLVKLLELLLSEDRSKRIKSEKQRVREYLKRVNKIIKQQKSLQGKTERAGQASELADEQNELALKTGKLAGDMKPDDANPAGQASDADADSSQQGDPQPGNEEGDTPGDKPNDAKPAGDNDRPKDGQGEKKDPPDKQPSDSESDDAPPVDPPEGDQQSEQDGQPGQQGQQDQQGQQGQSGQQSQQQSAQQRLEQAQQRMQQAQQKLEDAQRSDAVEEQAEAIRELEKAKAELEEILRQLREEEMARTLAMLEARFRKMLNAQIEVFEGTKRLDGVPAAERDRDDDIEAGRLSRQESQIAVEADKALAILREEGSAVAFPEAVTEIRDDMRTVSELLAETKVGALTQGIEEDIIAALEEMITALKKAQKDMENKNQQPQQQSSGDSEMPLVDALSELKMIRALQMRVNKRTKRYAALSETEEVDQAELLEALQKLAEREKRIHRVTRDIVVGRNR